VDVDSVIDTSKGLPEIVRTIALWEGLVKRGLLHGEIERQGDFATLHLDHVPAPWMLGSRNFAAAYNKAYERAYPGALADLGIPPEALTGPDSWETWLTGTL
jgi:hypothetical protein